jgi:phosphoribosylanthranilate isomerase
MSLEVKICGINSIEAAQAAKIADFVGFVFYPRSPRYINGKKAQELSTYCHLYILASWDKKQTLQNPQFLLLGLLQ